MVRGMLRYVWQNMLRLLLCPFQHHLHNGITVPAMQLFHYVSYLLYWRIHVHAGPSRVRDFK
jgi:hypothetical protein